jgi:hypothetical protein
VKHPRELIAVVVVVVGGTLWLVLPASGGSLRDESTAVRFRLSPGRALAGWVLVRNRGVDAVTLTRASIAGLPAGVSVLGTAVRPGFFPVTANRWPSTRKAFVPVDGYVVTPGRKATLAFGLRFAHPVSGRLSGVRIAYRENDHPHNLTIATPELCVKVNPREC